MKNTVAAAGLFLLSSASGAGAVEFVFEGLPGGAAVDSPTGNIALDCGSVGADYCSDNDALGFTYSKDGVSFTAVGYAGGNLTESGFRRGGPNQLIQDLVSPNQGLGVFSEGGHTLDQINWDAGESIVFSFAEEVRVSNIWLNSGVSVDCPDVGGAEGPCGGVGVIVDGVFHSLSDYLAGGLLATGGAAAAFIGDTFEFIGLTAGAGYSIERFTVEALTVSEVPLPAAAPLLLVGGLGLGAASRRRKARQARAVVR